jgi:hypothetical protein
MIVMIVIASFRVSNACQVQVPELGLRIIRLCCGLLRTFAVASGEAVTLANVVDRSLYSCTSLGFLCGMSLFRAISGSALIRQAADVHENIQDGRYSIVVSLCRSRGTHLAKA